MGWLLLLLGIGVFHGALLALLLVAKYSGDPAQEAADQMT